MHRIKVHLDRAEQAEREALQVIQQEHKGILLEIARTWRRMAEDLQRQPHGS